MLLAVRDVPSRNQGEGTQLTSLNDIDALTATSSPKVILLRLLGVTFMVAAVLEIDAFVR